MKPINYECPVCDYWEIMHGKEDTDPERHKKCQNCSGRERRELEYRNQNRGGRHE